MWTKEGIEERLKYYIENLNRYKEWINERKIYLKGYYLREHKNWNLYHEEYGEIACNELGFNTLIDICFDYIDKQKCFIDKIMSLDIIKENKFNRQIILLIDECLSMMESEIPCQMQDNIIFETMYKIDFAENYSSILLLARFSEVESNIVVIGGNGSGKSSLANALKGNDTENICIIPAQKSLYFSMNDMSMLSTRKSDLVQLMLENNISRSKTKDDYGYFNFQNNQFTKLIVAMKEQYTDYLIKCEEEHSEIKGETTIFGQLRNVFKVVFPGIRLKFNSDAREYLNCIKNGVSYHVNALSEGEKAVIYYSISVLMAKNDSFIVVDEPETYLNPSLTNLLWDYLIKVRTDCQFIFITHSVDFVLSRQDSKIAWIKNFIYPDKWDFDFIEDEFVLPKTLMTEILGSKKPIAFCEGNDKSSLDYVVYRALLGKEYTVIPLGGHTDVIRNCEVISSSAWLNLDSIGLVDGDYYTEEKIELLKSKNITVLPFNEVEMLLVSDEVLTYTLQAVYPVEFQDKIDKFKKEFFKYVERQKSKIALYNVTMEVNEFIGKEKIQTMESIDAIKENLNKISQYNVQELYNKKIEQIESIVCENNYIGLLTVCNLKKEITRGLANKFLDSDYETKAVQQIQTNEELKNILKETYFL